MVDVHITKDLENKTLTVEYTVEAPKEKVWRAYSEKELFEKWWGPEGWETTTKTFDFKPGGRVHYCMKCIDKNQGEWFGQEAWGLMDIQSIDEGDNFVFVDHFSDEQGTLNAEMPVLTITNTFTEKDGKTTVVSRCVAESAEQIEELIKMGMIEGYKSQLNRIEAVLQ